MNYFHDIYKSKQFFSPFYSCRIHGAKGGLTLILLRYIKRCHKKFCTLSSVLICVEFTTFTSPLRNISPCASAPLLDWQDDYKTRRRSAGLCHHCRLHSPAKERKETSTSVLPRSQCSWLQEVLQKNSVKGWGSCGPWVHLFVLLNGLLLGLGDDAFQFVEASLHLGEAQPGVLLLPPDALQLFLAVLLSNAGALLPLLDALGKDLIDPTVENKSYLSIDDRSMEKMTMWALT